MKTFPLLHILLCPIGFGLGWMARDSNFASGGVKSKHAGSERKSFVMEPVRYDGVMTESFPRNSDSGISAPPAGNSLVPEWLPNPDKPLRPQLAIYASSEPEKAAALALSIPWSDGDGEEDPPVNDPLCTVVEVWAKDSPTEATAFHDSLTDPQRKLGAALGLVEGLAANDVSLAATWVEQQMRHPDFVAFVSLLVPYMEPKRAQRWLASLPLDENARELTRGLVASRPRGPAGEEEK